LIKRFGFFALLAGKVREKAAKAKLNLSENLNFSGHCLKGQISIFSHKLPGLPKSQNSSTFSSALF
jgi:hypothetical protein